MANEKVDVVIVGAVLIPGAKAPRLVRREDLKRMPTRAVIIDDPEDIKWVKTKKNRDATET